MAADKGKRTFEFRMSKKVAELTQVVHMLFTRNHEKEVEIDALKEAYEHEIHLVTDDAKGRISLLDDRMRESERILQYERTSKEEMIKSAVEKEISTQEQEWQRKITATDKQLQEEKTECQNLRDLLINAQRDIEKLRKGVTDQLSAKTEEINKKDKEIEKLQKQMMSQEKSLKETEKQSHDKIAFLEKNSEAIEKEYIQLQELLEETHRAKEILAGRNRQLEIDLKQLRRDFSRKVSEVVASQQGPMHKVTKSAMSYADYNDEVERLRRENQRYRLELSNRDSNFNRMFADQQPVVVDPRAGKIGINQHHVIQSARVEPVAMSPRERSFSYAFVHSYEDSKRTTPSSRVSSAASAAASDRLPVLTAEQRARLNKMVKPRPLSKEMLYSKN